MSVTLALLLIWLVALPSLFFLTLVVYPRYLRRHVARTRDTATIVTVKQAAPSRHRARPGI